MLVVLNDTQLYRNCDEEALGAALSFIKEYKDKITHLVLNGDITDYEQQSKFAKLPDGYQQALDEIQSTKWLFKYLAELCPNAEKVMIDGNHDMRWSNMMKDQTMGIEHWLKTPSEMFRYKELGWKHIPYAVGNFYRWHDRAFWHGSRAGKKMDIAKAELDDMLGLSVTTAHINRNMYHEEREATGKLRSAYTHGGFSKDNLNFVRSANSKWSQGFGVYYWSKETGEQAYSINMRHHKPEFIFEGKVFSGRGFKIFDKGRKIR